MIGQTISHYKILEKLGEGGMGVVYKAEDKTLNRPVALKFLSSELTSDKEAKARFMHEAQAASALDHPNICTVYEIGEMQDGASFIAMACYEGETLKETIRRGPLRIDQVTEITLQIAHGLSKAHEKGIAHRDIKPANILVTTDGVVKILDFGLAKLGVMSKLTKSGSTVGTAPYMSPEQTNGEPVDHRTDLWSLGVVLYEMITGQLPFRGDYAQAVTYQILNSSPEPVTALRSGVPMDLERIVNKCLEKFPGERYQSAADMIADLKHLQRTAAGSISSFSQGVAPSRNKHRQRYLVAAALLIAVVAFVIFFKPFSAGTVKNMKSIAVLPFKILSSDKETEYISHGIAEDIRTQLSKIADLRVISQQGMEKYEKSDKSIREIGAELNVAVVLEGSIQCAGSQVRINAQLIDASDESHIWAEKYDKEMTQIFTVQSDVAQQIASVLKAKLLPSEKEIIEKRPTNNLTAYDYYLKGREYYCLYRKQDNETAIGLFTKAIELDTNYALALAGLADACAQRWGNFGEDKCWVDSSIIIANRAIAKDGSCAEAYKALGLGYEYKGFYHRAIEINRKALEFNPNLSPAIANIGDDLSRLGKYVEGMKWRKKALRLNPTVALYYTQIAMWYGFLADEINTEKYFNRSLELQPDNPGVYVRKWGLHLSWGQIEEASKASEKAFSFDHDTSSYDDRSYYLSVCNNNIKAKTIAYKFAARGDSSYLVRFYWNQGKKEEARRMWNDEIEAIRKSIDAGNEDSWAQFHISCLYALQEEHSKALDWLRKAMDGGFLCYRNAETDPDLMSVRNDEQFRRMIAEMKANAEEQKKRLAEIEKEEDQ